MHLKDFSYDLPQELIAQYPLKDRDQARLLIVERSTEKIHHDIFSNVGKYLPKQSTLVLNNSKVIPARLLGHRESGGKVEIFLLKNLGSGSYEALLKPLKKLKEGEQIILEKGLSAQITDIENRTVHFEDKNFEKKLLTIGHMPLPLYITRPDEALDRKLYQTVYAKHKGSVASPTAGLHFTKPLLSKLKKQGHTIEQVTLHVNYATFKPVEVEDITKHQMHFEHYEVGPGVYTRLMKAKTDGQKIVAVGTTSLRVLESVARSGNLKAETNLFLYPGCSFKMVDCLITNFHQPHTTLLMLVHAFAGTDLMRFAYKEAIDKKYRFFSYGDAMIII
jgi:S-adenosylmethionine:tRNA ribosyltransferase-isomerase